MNRQTTLLTAVGAVLILALYWMFLLAPKRTELNDIKAATQTAMDEQRSLQNQLDSLRDIRARAPEVEAQLAATEALVPSGPALPPTLRQLQLAADESGMTLTSISPGEPSAVSFEGLPPGASEMTLTLSLSGSYFQIVDFLRRIEDPSITPRGIIWDAMSVGPASYPTLGLSLTGRMFLLDRGAVGAGGAG